MEKVTKKSFLQSSTELELMNMPIEVILEEAAQRYDDLWEQAQGSELATKVALALDERLGHSCILFHDGERLALTHPAEGQRLMAASISWQETRGLETLDGEMRSRFLTRLAAIRKAREEAKKKKMKDRKK